MSTLTPKDHAEAIALFRSEIVGALTRRELDRGELALALTELSQQRFRPPNANSTKAFSVPTLERWYYAYKSGGLEGLRPSPRSDRGRCRELTCPSRWAVVNATIQTTRSGPYHNAVKRVRRWSWRPNSNSRRNATLLTHSSRRSHMPFACKRRLSSWPPVKDSGSSCPKLIRST